MTNHFVTACTPCRACLLHRVWWPRLAISRRKSKKIRDSLKIDQPGCETRVTMQPMGRVRITSWYPNFIGSYLARHPARSTEWNGLPPKIVWTMTYWLRPHFTDCHWFFHFGCDFGQIKRHSIDKSALAPSFSKVFLIVGFLPMHQLYSHPCPRRYSSAIDVWALLSIKILVCWFLLCRFVRSR